MTEENKDKKKIQPYKDSSGRNIYPEEITDCERCGKNEVPQKPGVKRKRLYCDNCIKIKKQQSLAAARRTKHDMAEAEKLKTLEEAVSPAGEKIYLKDKDEGDFYNNRKNAYLSDFELNTAADTTLLSRLLTLEIECRRIEKNLMTNDKGAKFSQETLSKLTEQIRRVQIDLGINRASRKEREKDKTSQDLLSGIMEKFRMYREKNKHLFIWQCEHCKKKNYLHKRNTGDYVSGKPEAEQPNTATE